MNEVNKSTIRRKVALAAAVLITVPSLAAAFPVYPPSASATALVEDSNYTQSYCSSGNQPSSASCDTGVISGISDYGNAYSASGSSQASLANADLEGRATVSGGAETTANGIAALTDTLYFSGAFPSDAHALFTMTATGDLSGNSAARISLLGYWSSSSFLNVQSSTANAIGSFCNTVPTLGTTTCASNNGTDLMISMDLPLSLLSNGFNFVANLTCATTGGDGAGGTGISNCNYTDPFTVTLPQGVTFTSQSGLFLTAPVPVPAAGWLFGSGLLGLIGAAGRKKAA